jgi:hypothetical protein
LLVESPQSNDKLKPEIEELLPWTRISLTTRSLRSTYFGVWELLEKPQRTPEEDDTMLNAAHASRYHWQQVGTPINLVRGEWQISRVYATLQRAEPALYHAQRCLTICLAHAIGDFDLAFAYEALARASAISGDWERLRHFRQLAEQAGEAITDDDDKEIFLKL